MNTWLLPTLGSMICWGIWGFLPKLTTQFLPPRSAIIYEVGGGVLFSVALMVVLQFRPAVHPIGIPLAIVTGLFGFLGAFCFLNAVMTGPVTLVATVSALYPVISVVLAMVFLHESITLRQGLGVALALIAMLLVAA
jgi:bacterial/archaeal transporter family protein